MQKKEDNHGNFIFDPSQFLTTTQIKSYFSRLSRTQRIRGSQSQYSNNAHEDEDEDLEEAENEFDSMVSNLQEEMVLSVAEDRFFALQKTQSRSNAASK